MSNRFLNLEGTDKIKDTYEDINAAFEDVANELDIQDAKDITQDSRMDDHVEGTAEKHNSSDIVNDSTVTGTNVDDALEVLKAQIEGIETGDSNALIGVYSINAVGTNTLTGTYADLTYFAGLKVNLKIAIENTEGVTFNLNGLGSKNIYKVVSGIKTPLEAGEFGAGKIYTIEYDGTDFIAIDLRDGEYTTSDEVTKEIISLGANATGGAFKKLDMLGNTAVNVVNNGNFADGTTGWTTAGGTASVSDNVISVTGNGSSSAPYTQAVINANPDNGREIYVNLWARVTNSSCAYVQLRIFGSGGGVATYDLNTPTADSWYKITQKFTLDGTYSGDLTVRVAQYYADAATANGKVIEIKEVLAIDMGINSNNPLFGLTQSDMDDRFPTYFDGMKGSDKIRLLSVGKNLVPNDLELGDISISDGSESVSTTRQRLRGYYEVEALTNYIMSTSESISFMTAIFFNANFEVLGYDASTSSDENAFTTPSQTKYVRLKFGTTNDIIIQLERGSTATDYEPYTSTQAIAPVALYSVPDGTACSFDCNTGLHTQRVVKWIPESADFSSLNTSATNIDRVVLDVPADCVTFVTNTSTYENKVFMEEFTELPYADSSDNEWHFYNGTSQTLYLCVPKGTYASIGDARTALVGMEVVYQLATPVETPYYPNVLNAKPNGTIHVGSFIEDVSVYNGGFTILDSSYPINLLEYVYKVNMGPGLPLTPVSISTCTVAAGGLSFTSTALTDGDYVVTGYHHRGVVLPTTEYSHSTNTEGQLNYLSDQVAQVDKKANTLSKLLDVVFGEWSDWTPSLTWGTADPEGNVAIVARYKRVDNVVYFTFSYAADDGNAADSLTISLPIAPEDNSTYFALNAQQKVDTTWSNPLAVIDTSALVISFNNFSVATNAASVEVIVSGSYEV